MFLVRSPLEPGTATVTIPYSTQNNVCGVNIVLDHSRTSIFYAESVDILCML